MDIASILKNVPKGTTLYSPIFGDVKFDSILENNTIIVERNDGDNEFFYSDGTYSPSKYYLTNGECMLFPSRDNRDWSTFNQVEYKPFDKVLTRRRFLNNGPKDYWIPKIIACKHPFDDSYFTIDGYCYEINDIIPYGESKVGKPCE